MQASNHSFAVGHADQMAYYAGRRAPAAWPHQVGAVPNTARCFQHRAVIDIPDAPVRYRILVGTAGVGKTQPAANEVRTAWQAGQLDLLVWVTAGSRVEILTACSRAIAEITGSDPADPKQGAREFLAWLRPGGDGEAIRWLIVLDGLVDPDDLRGLWPPDQPVGRTLVTTWRRDLAPEGLGRQVVRVPSFSSTEAFGYLTAVLAESGRVEPPEQLESLAREFGHLPVALAQAAAYLSSTGLSCADYLRLLGDHGRQLADCVQVPRPGADRTPGRGRGAGRECRRDARAAAPVEPARLRPGGPRPVRASPPGGATSRPRGRAREPGRGAGRTGRQTAPRTATVTGTAGRADQAVARGTDSRSPGPDPQQ